jgi:hypothetical protein
VFAPSDHGLHTTLPKLATVLIVVIAPVSEHPLGAPTGTPRLASDRTNAIDKRQ